jgi:hypothetical protein
VRVHINPFFITAGFQIHHPDFGMKCGFPLGYFLGKRTRKVGQGWFGAVYR